MPTDEDQHRLFRGYFLTLAQLDPLVYPLDDDSRCLVLTPQDTLKAHELMAATFNDEQQPEFEPVQIQGGCRPQSECTHIAGVRLGMCVSVMNMWLATVVECVGLHEARQPSISPPHR